MTLAEYYNLPEGTNATLKYSLFYDTVDSDFPCQTNISYICYQQGNRAVLKKINVTSATTQMQYLFHSCYNLYRIDGIENWDVSNVSSLSNLFYDCSKLISLDISNWDVSNVTDMDSLFSGCGSLTSLDISNWDTSNVTTLNNLINGCYKLKSLSSIRADKLNIPSYSGPFGYNALDELTDFGGFINLKSSVGANYGFKSLPNLNYQSCINVLNGLYDFVGNGVTPSSSQGKLTVHQNFLTTVGDEISIGTNKGWTITT